MMRKIRDLDFDAIIERIASATDMQRRKACDDITEASIERIHTPADAWTDLRDHLVIAIVRHANDFDDVGFGSPLVQALVRAQHHPLAEPIQEFGLRGGFGGPDVAPHLARIVDDHPELSWDLDAIQELIIRAIREHGDHALDDSQPPWLMHWDRASAAATALIELVTLRKLGDLS